MTLVFLGGFSFSTKSVKAAESDKAITAFTVPIQARTLFEDDFNSYNDGDLNGQGSWSGSTGCQVQAGSSDNPEGSGVGKEVKCVLADGNDWLIDKIETATADGRAVVYFKVSNTTYNYDGVWVYASDALGFRLTIVGTAVFLIGNTVPGAISANTWYPLIMEWRSSDNKCRASLDDVNWTDWITQEGVAISLDRIRIEGYSLGGSHDFYFDYIAENPYGEETPTTSIATINESAKTIVLTMPYGTVITALVPTVTINGASVSPASGEAHDFTATSTYTVTAADSSTSTYAVTVTVAAYTDKAITAFTVPNQAGTTTINESSTTIALTMPYGTVVTSLVPTIAIAGESVSPASLIPTNFTSPVIYTVTAADSSTSTYAVTVTVAANPAKAITAFTVPNQAGTTTINESSTTIALTMPYGTDITALVATFTITGSSVAVGSTTQESGTTTNDFTSPVIYTVTAADTTAQDYTVTVTVNPAPTTSGMGGGGGGGGGGAITMAISQETPTQVTSNSVKINWSTTLFSTSRVIYDTVAGKFNSIQSPNYGYAFSTIEQDTPSGTNEVTYHTVWINGLTPDTTYYYRAISHASPDTIGQEFSFTTAQGSAAEQLIPSEEEIPLAPAEEVTPPPTEEAPLTPAEETPVAPEEETTPTSSPALFDILTQPEAKQSQRNLLIPILFGVGILMLVITGFVLYRRRRKVV